MAMSRSVFRSRGQLYVRRNEFRRAIEPSVEEFEDPVAEIELSDRGDV